MHVDVAELLFQRAVASEGLTWRLSSVVETPPPASDSAGVQFWDSGWPIQLRLRKRGSFRLLAPVNSNTVQWLLAEGTSRFHPESELRMSGQLTYTYAGDLGPNDYWRSKEKLGRYTESDREFLQEQDLGNVKYLYTYLAAFVPVDLEPAPPLSQESREYRRLYRQLIGLLPKQMRFTPSSYQEHGNAINSFIQYWSHWPSAWQKGTTISPMHAVSVNALRERTQAQRSRAAAYSGVPRERALPQVQQEPRIDATAPAQVTGRRAERTQAAADLINLLFNEDEA